MNSGFRGEHAFLGVYDPVYTPNDPSQGLLAFGTSTVGPQAEFPDVGAMPQTGAGPVAHTSFDISAHTIKLRFPDETQGETLPSGGYDGYVLAFKGNPTQDISAIRLLSTNIGGITPETVEFNGHQVFINGAGAELPAGQAPYITLGVRFSGSDALAAHAAKRLVTGE